MASSKKVTGKDLQVKPTKIVLQGREFELNFDLNAMSELEDKYDTIQNAIVELKKKKLSAVRTFVYACLKSSDESLTEHEVGKLIDINSFPIVEKAITNLMNDAMEESESEDIEEQKEKN